jgi:hypothetical protein
MLVKADATGIFYKTRNFTMLTKLRCPLTDDAMGTEHTCSEVIPIMYLLLQDQVSISRAQKYHQLQKTE